MKERPLRCGMHELRALLDGTKTQTRRVVKLRDKTQTFSQFGEHGQPDSDGWPWSCNADGDWYKEQCPYGTVGDRLWVAEAWAIRPFTRNVAYRFDGECGAWGGDGGGGRLFVRHGGVFWKGGPMRSDSWRGQSFGLDHFGRWRSSTQMPRWASRFTLTLTAIRAERVQDISEADAQAEGAGKWAMVGIRDAIFPCKPYPQPHEEGTHRFGFACRFDAINGAGSWDANPWVWVLTHTLERSA